MNPTTTFLRRDPAEVAPWAETCGQLRCLIEEKDGAAAEVHHVEIHDAKLHYHERTDEFYYVIAGQGTTSVNRRTAKSRRKLRLSRSGAQAARQNWDMSESAWQ